MAELHVIGQISGCQGFVGEGFWCRYSVHMGKGWRSIDENLVGQTHIDHPTTEQAVWSHPIDWHFVLPGVDGWPRVFFKVFARDRFNRDDFAGYGVLSIPSQPGHYEIEVPTWRPTGTIGQRISSFFVGGSPELEDEAFVYGDSSRFDLSSESSGRVLITIAVIPRNFASHGVELSSQRPRSDR